MKQKLLLQLDILAIVFTAVCLYLFINNSLNFVISLLIAGVCFSIDRIYKSQLNSESS